MSGNQTEPVPLTTEPSLQPSSLILFILPFTLSRVQCTWSTCPHCPLSSLLLQTSLLSNFPSYSMHFREGRLQSTGPACRGPISNPSPVGNGEAARPTCNLVIVLFSLRQGRALGSKLGEEGLREHIARTVGPHGFLSFSISPECYAAEQAFLPTSC